MNEETTIIRPSLGADQPGGPQIGEGLHQEEGDLKTRIDELT